MGNKNQNSKTNDAWKDVNPGDVKNWFETTIRIIRDALK